MADKESYSLGIVGVRGYVGKELLALIANHPQIKTQWLSSRQLAGQTARTVFENNDQSHSNEDLDFIIESLSPEEVANRNTDIIVLALPNGFAEPYVKAIEGRNKAKLVIDLSADYRFSDDWIYSIPELDYNALHGASSSRLIKISNPGCYATAMQLALAPIKDRLAGPAHCFGVSGFSGAGTTPSPKNDADNLKNNIIGYALIEHLHEKEVSVRLNQPVSFTPHVAAFFRGIHMTVQVDFIEPQTSADLLHHFENFYQLAPLVNCQLAPPEVKQITNTANCLIGGFAISQDGKRGTIISCLDNLLKGAASQALQNINLALKLEPILAVEATKQTSGEKP